jgi:hypothetical protein
MSVRLDEARSHNHPGRVQDVDAVRDRDLGGGAHGSDPAVAHEKDPVLQGRGAVAVRVSDGQDPGPHDGEVADGGNGDGTVHGSSWA